MATTIFEACLEIIEYDDTNALLQCVADRLEKSNTATAKKTNSELIVLR
jgi:hypothetical protein